MSTETTAQLAARVTDDCFALAKFSESEVGLKRTFLSRPVKDVHAWLTKRLSALGIEARVDAAGNLRGIYAGKRPDAPRLLIGSHIDTVPDAGAYDGVLGVALALALLESLNGRRFEYAIEFVAFSEEEGVRFGFPFIGSRALIGELNEEHLQRSDGAGITLLQAIRDFGLEPSGIAQAALDSKVVAFVEFHIEQGPVLESLNASIGVVEAIAGQSRLEVVFRGEANHAGTTPMGLRKDALAAASEWILAVEKFARETAGLTATVGAITASPNASNVVPGYVKLSLDVRHASDLARFQAVEHLVRKSESISSARRVSPEVRSCLDQPAVRLSEQLIAELESAIRATGHPVHRMVSGAGHDAMVMAKKLPSAMLFVRSPGGISHHPAETVLVEDVQAALEAGLYFLNHLNVDEFDSQAR